MVALLGVYMYSETDDVHGTVREIATLQQQCTDRAHPVHAWNLSHDRSPIILTFTFIAGHISYSLFADVHVIHGGPKK